MLSTHTVPEIFITCITITIESRIEYVVAYLHCTQHDKTQDLYNWYDYYYCNIYYFIVDALHSNYLSCISHYRFSSLIEKWITINCFHCFYLKVFNLQFSSELFFVSLSSSLLIFVLFLLRYLRQSVEKSRNDPLLWTPAAMSSAVSHTHTRSLTDFNRRRQYKQCPLSYINQNCGAPSLLFNRFTCRAVFALNCADENC